MKINDITKTLSEKFSSEITNKEVITFLKEHGFDVSSHMQAATDDMIKCINDNFVVEKVTDIALENDLKEETQTYEIDNSVFEKKYDSDEIITCRSVVPYKLCAVGVDKGIVYNWEYFGDIDYLKFKDLQALRRSDYVTKPLFIIEDSILCYRWRKELGDTYKHYTGVQYPEEFFDKSDVEFQCLLNKCPDILKDVIKITAMAMIKNKNYPSVQKLEIIDSTLGTCLKEFI